MSGMALPGFMSGDGVDPVEDELIDKTMRTHNLRVENARLRAEVGRLEMEPQKIVRGMMKSNDWAKGCSCPSCLAAVKYNEVLSDVLTALAAQPEEKPAEPAGGGA